MNLTYKVLKVHWRHFHLAMDHTGVCHLFYVFLLFSSVFTENIHFAFGYTAKCFFLFSPGFSFFFSTGNSFLPHQPTRSTLPWTDGAFHCFLHSPKVVKRNKNVIWYNTVLRQLIISFKKSNTRRGIRNYISLRIGLIEWT